MVKVFRSRLRGRGIKADKDYKEGDLIEVCHVLLFDVGPDESHLLHEYAFRWDKKRIALLLGFGSLYNHKYAPNAVTFPNKRSKVVEILALESIRKGQEIFLDYSGGTGNPLWFSVS